MSSHEFVDEFMSVQKYTRVYSQLERRRKYFRKNTQEFLIPSLRCEKNIIL
jgi:hypothetical protein